ncbi:Soluble calcium-activated nucleotidase 1 [Armadillidium nasatum]|uniref:Apyrase n=1 Tax=Armadillidium nasatum TaxID=96803 RepID=A0A5N5SLA2_9CRUS|nr:Soluble calcium-activated nucleotidase 1 [Armadillidium nasatum]
MSSLFETSSPKEKMIDSGTSSVLMDMRQAVFNGPPFSYRVGSSTLHVQTKFVSIVALAGLMCLIILFLALPSYHISGSNLTSNLWTHGEEHGHGHKHNRNWFTSYNSTYPLTPPVYSARGYIKYRIAIISDLDTSSKVPSKDNLWISYLKKGYLTINIDSLEITAIEWDKDTISLESQMAYGGRGMELSELVTFNGKLYALDDRTGIVYEIDSSRNKAIPWVILTDGNGRESKGFKGEWATVKDDTLIIGGLGKEWTSPTGELLNHNPQFVKTITPQGFIQHHDWTKNYEKLREADNIHFPGYLIHESCVWSEIWQRWVFLPRRASSDKYTEDEDEHRGTNLMLQATEGFEDIKVSRVGDVIETHGFSSFKFIPGTKDRLIVALKSEEIGGKAATYVMAFDISGKIIFPEKKIADYKFEGIEFI